MYAEGKGVVSCWRTEAVEKVQKVLGVAVAWPGCGCLGLAYRGTSHISQRVWEAGLWYVHEGHGQTGSGRPPPPPGPAKSGREGRVWCECGVSAAAVALAWLEKGECGVSVVRVRLLGFGLAWLWLGLGLAWHVPAGEAIPPGLCCAALLPGA